MIATLLFASLLSAPRASAADPVEVVPAGESDAIARIAGLIEATVTRDRRDSGAAHRDAHAKAHGCVRGDFQVEDGLAPELRQGVFREARTYKSWIRFSNGAGRAAKDSADDARGMAVKVLGVPGPKLSDDEKGTQDFLLIGGPRFFVRNAEDYVEFSRDAAAGKPFSFFLPGFNPFHWRLHELRAALALVKAPASDPLGLRYWSVVPFLMGESGPAKFSARPCAPPPSRRTDRKDPDFLRAALSSDLKDRAACFEFLVQLRARPEREPVEDPTVGWSEKRSPFRRVATIRIPPQRFEGEAQRRFCEDLSMNPWHSVPEHRPLGGINRARKVVYAAISKLRHEFNGAPRTEPTGDEVFPD